MKIHRSTSAVLCLLLLLPALAWAGPSTDRSALFDSIGKEPEGTPVTATLVAEASSVAPGGSVWLGIHLVQEPGWHTYWKNAGDAGLATSVLWDLPEGWTVSDLVWPTPHRYVEAGDLVTFGYSDETLLMARLDAPADAAGGKVEIRGRVDWLMCNDLCVPGRDDVAVTLQVGGADGAVAESTRALFDRARTRVPVPVDKLEGLRIRTAYELATMPPGQTAHVVISVEGAGAAGLEWVWFPDSQDDVSPEPAASRVVEDRLLIAVPLSLSASAEAGATLKWGGVLELDGDGVDPVFVQVDLPIEVASAGSTLASTDPELVASALGVDSTQSPIASGGRSLFYYLLLALVGGVILNVMPCVLPVLSLKVMSFVHHAGQDRGVQFRLGLMFTAGVLASFLALALIVIALQAAGDLVGWGFQFQNPVFVVVMAAVVFGFGMSLFGVYEIILPVQMGGGGGRSSAYVESFFNGVLATALATPCTAPLLGAALGFAFSQPPSVILAIFLTAGLGLSLPYLVLSLNPGWLRFIPKPGAWMDRFKQGMGFLLMATLIWLLWVLGQQVGLDSLASVMIFLLVLGFALWIYGSALTLSSSTTRHVVVWVLVLGMVVGAWWKFVDGKVGVEAVAAHASAASEAGHGDWIEFSEERLAAEVEAGNTVFIDFSAAWCMTCKVNERTVINSDAVQSRLEELGVVRLLGDWTNRDETITRILRKHGRSGVPFYAVYRPGQLEDPIVLPEVITRSIVVHALDEAGPSQSVVGQN